MDPVADKGICRSRAKNFPTQVPPEANASFSTFVRRRMDLQVHTKNKWSKIYSARSKII